VNIEKLPRNPMRREDEPGYEKEIWQPHWKCFCCHDTGIIVPQLAALAIDGYDFNRDKLPRCTKTGCFAESHWDGEMLTNCVDYRISPATCFQLDAIEREGWKETARAKQIKIQALVEKMRLSSRSRTPSEEMEIQRRHEEICNADPEKLRAIAEEYLGSDYMKNGAS
jgi:hypothetical protein